LCSNTGLRRLRTTSELRPAGCALNSNRYTYTIAYYDAVTTELYRIRAVVESIYARHRVFVWASNQLQGKSKTARARSAAPLRGPDSYCEKKKAKNSGGTNKIGRRHPELNPYVYRLVYTVLFVGRTP